MPLSHINTFTVALDILLHFFTSKKVKQSRYTPWRRLGEEVYSSYSFSTSALDGGEWSASRPGRALTPGERTPGIHWTGGWGWAYHTTAVLPLDVADGAPSSCWRVAATYWWETHPILCVTQDIYTWGSCKWKHTIHNTELVTIILRAAGDTSRHVFCCTARGTCRWRQMSTHKHRFQKSLWGHNVEGLNRGSTCWILDQSAGVSISILEPKAAAATPSFCSNSLSIMALCWSSSRHSFQRVYEHSFGAICIATTFTFAEKQGV
jgi:hypothetical protein